LFIVVDVVDVVDFVDERQTWHKNVFILICQDMRIKGPYLLIEIKVMVSCREVKCNIEWVTGRDAGSPGPGDSTKTTESRNYVYYSLPTHPLHHDRSLRHLLIG